MDLVSPNRRRRFLLALNMPLDRLDLCKRILLRGRLMGERKLRRIAHEAIGFLLVFILVGYR